MCKLWYKAEFFFIFVIYIYRERERERRERESFLSKWMSEVFSPLIFVDFFSSFSLDEGEACGFPEL